ncbi:Protein mlp1 [Malassezia obtusa]|uniref:Protein mlp1 n=1 Tax=Malassezia obtusa TaxID=76774 RepID=A0AAF0E1C7_9BASI|nr:Protein mlp1 [Malassezia obtusa]
MGDLEARVAALEDEKRKLLSSWQRERDENTRKNEELAALSSRNQSMRTELSQATLALEQAQSVEHTSKFKTRALEQQLAIARQDTEWARKELAKEHEASAAARAELTARLTRAETALELATQERSSTVSQLAHTERALSDVQARHAEATSRLTQLQTAAASQEQDAHLEIDGLKRSVELSEARVQHAEHRAAQLEATCDELVARCGEREDEAQRAVVAEQSANAELREENASLQAALDRLAGALGVEVKDSAVSPSPAPSTAAAFAAQVHRDGKSFSDVYLDLVRSQEELRRERAETGRLEGVLAEVMADLDAHAPQLKAQRDENTQLRTELDAATGELASAAAARDAAESDAADAHAELARVQREYAQTSQQLRDASLQVRTLLREVVLLRDPSSEARLEDDGTPLGTEARSDDIHAVITEQLVTFRSLTELCSQNSRLLHAVRELGTRMESTEGAANDEAVREATQLVEAVRAELETERAAAAHVRRERDMFRDACLATESKTPAPPPARDDALRTELAAARAETQRVAAARDAAHERVAVLQSSAELHEGQLREARTHLERVHALLASRDQAVEAKEQALLTAQGTLEQVRAQLHSATTEARVAAEQRDMLLDENAKLQLARSTAEQALAEAQHARSAAADERTSEHDRLRDEAAQLRIALAAAEARAGEEQQQASNATLRREVETRALQERLDSLAQQHTQAREALATAQANAMHAERRASDLQAQLEQARAYTTLFEKQLAAAEESRRAAAAAALGVKDAAAESGLSPERQLEMELMDVRRGRAAAQAETLDAQAKLQASVEAQKQMQEALTAAEQARDAARAEKEAGDQQREQLAAEHQRALDAQAADAAALRTALAEAQSALESAKTSFASEKRELEDALAGLSRAEADEAANAPQAWEEVRKFSRLAKEAEARAADAASAQSDAQRDAERLRAELQRATADADAQRHARDLAEAESNKNALATEAHVRALEKNVDALKVQRDELQEQNTQLHAHLEAVGQREASHGEELASAGDLHKVIRYLRREKDALELQAELARQEQARLRQALERAEQETAAARAEKEAERPAPSETPNVQYTELLEKINQLSSLREHVTTLKEAKLALETRVETLTAQLHAAQQQLQPSREQLQTAQVDLETCQTQLRVVQEDVARWKNRTEGLLKSNGVTDAMQKVEAERQEAQKAVEAARAELASEKTRLSSELHTANTRFEQLREQVRARITQERRSVAEATERGNQLQQERDAAVAKAEEERQALQAKIDALEKEHAKPEEGAGGQPEQGTEPAAGEQAEKPDASEAQAAWEAEKAELNERLRVKTEECDKHKSYGRIFLRDKRAAEAQVKTHEARIEELEKKLAALDQDPKAEESKEPSGAVAESSETKPEPTEAQPAQPAESAPAESAPAESAPQAPSSDASHAEQVEALRARIAELEALLDKANKRIAELEAANAADDAKDAKIAELSKQLSAPDGLQAALEAKEAELKAHYQPLLQSRYDDGKHEATLRNTIMLKQRDNKITKLTNEVQELKTKLGIATDAPAPKAATSDGKDTQGAKETKETKDSGDAKPDAESKPQPARPAVVRGGAPARGGRGGGPKPVPLLQRTAKPAEGTSIRGAAATRGTTAKGRGALSVAGGAKRKREQNASTTESEAKPKPGPKKSKNQEGES